MNKTNIKVDKHEQLPVFVYGSLMDGFHNHYYLSDNYEKKTEGELKGFVISAGFGFPYLGKADNNNAVVHGELYDLKKECYKYIMGHLDKLEGITMVGYGYERDIVDIITKEGVRKAWVYRADQNIDKRRIISSGSWRQFVKEIENRKY